MPFIMHYALESVKVEDASGLAQAMTGAFMQSAPWALLWPKTLLEEIINGCTSRLPRNLATGRYKKRH
jgi:hypothetical protein